jgi:hypothetical protein
MGEEDVVILNLPGATKWLYHRLEERHDFKSAENQGETATEMYYLHGVLSILQFYCDIYLV